MSINFQSNITYINLQKSYIITMFAMWGLGVDFPRLLVRYAKSYPMVINIHNISMMIIGLMTILYVTARTIVFYTQNYKLGEVMVNIDMAQFVLSWILCGCVIIQFGLGFRLRYQLITDKLNNQMFRLKKMHRYLGTFMSILGKVIVALQIQPLQQNDGILLKIWLFVIGALILIFIILQIVYRIQTRSVMLKFPLKHQSKYRKYLQQILQKINSNVDTFRDYKQLGVRYIILDNKMYYIDQNFIHPGGQHIFSIYNGQQVNYLFRGTHQISQQYPRHNHTKYAINYLQSRQIGQIKVQSILYNYNNNTSQIVQWKLTAIQQMDGDINLVQFQADGALIKQMLNIQNFGKYVMISCPSQQIIGKISRPYTILISLCNLQQNILQRFKQEYKYYYIPENSSMNLLRNNNNKKQQQNLYDIQSRKSSLTFCIKKYQHGMFTKFMFSSQTQRRFKINGPFGRGLRLKPMSKGYYIIIAAGTGVLPFMDLFNYLLKKTLLKLIAEKAGPDTARNINKQRFQYDYLDDVKILFIGSFLSAKHFYMYQVIKDLHHLSIKHKLDIFHMKIRYNDSTKQPDIQPINQIFDKKFIQDLIKQQPDRIYYCGPSSIEQVIRKVQDQKNIKNLFFYL